MSIIFKYKIYQRNSQDIFESKKYNRPNIERLWLRVLGKLRRLAILNTYILIFFSLFVNGLFHNPENICDFLCTIPQIIYNSVSADCQMSVYPYQHYIVSVCPCYITHSCSVGHLRFEPKNIFQKMFVAAYTQSFTPKQLCYKVQFLLDIIIFEICGFANRPTDAIAFYVSQWICVVVLKHNYSCSCSAIQR